jgi:alkylhydroperoxidase family enzyme
LRSLIDKVAKRAYTVTDADIAAAKAAEVSEDQIFELVICAAIGQATRQYDTALAALDAADGKEWSCASPSSIVATVPV